MDIESLNFVILFWSWSYFLQNFWYDISFDLLFSCWIISINQTIFKLFSSKFVNFIRIDVEVSKYRFMIRNVALSSFIRLLHNVNLIFPPENSITPCWNSFLLWRVICVCSSVVFIGWSKVEISFLKIWEFLSFFNDGKQLVSLLKKLHVFVFKSIWFFNSFLIGTVDSKVEISKYHLYIMRFKWLFQTAHFIKCLIHGVFEILDSNLTVLLTGFKMTVWHDYWSII